MDLLLCSRRWMVDVRCWLWQQGLQPLLHPLAMIKASFDMGQLCNLGLGWCEKKLWGGLLGALFFCSVPCLSCAVCVAVPGCVPCWPWPCLGLLAWPWTLQTCWWVQDCSWPWLMPLNLLCLLRDCGTVLLACEVPAPGSHFACLGRGLAAPRYVCFFLFSVENKLLSWSECPWEGTRSLGRMACGNMWRGIILLGY